MSARPTIAEISVKLVDGSTNRFVQTNPDVIEKIVASVQPRALFEAPYLALETSEGVLVFMTSRIVRVDFVFDADVDWNAAIGETQIREMTPAEFGELYSPDTDPSLSREVDRQPGDTFHGYAHANVGLGEDVYFEINATIQSKEDQHQMMRGLLTGSTILFPRPAGGFSFLNLAQVNRINILPGQPDIARNAWPAEWLSQEGSEDEPRTLRLTRQD